MKLALDTNRLSIDELYMALRQLSPIADINISDPPLEEIIARIYGGDRPAASDEGSDG
ncbi:MAG: hypothetical protein ACOX18_06830 [Bacillota bacterium]